MLKKSISHSPVYLFVAIFFFVFLFVCFFVFLDKITRFFLVLLTALEMEVQLSVCWLKRL